MFQKPEKLQIMIKNQFNANKSMAMIIMLIMADCSLFSALSITKSAVPESTVPKSAVPESTVPKSAVPKSEELKSGYDRQDVSYLKKVCDNQDEDTDSANARLKACHYIKLIKAKNDTDCKTVVASYQEAGPSEAGLEGMKLIAKHFAACGHFKQIFELLAPVYHGSKDTDPLLVSLEESGVPLEAEFLRYATTESGSRFLRTEYAQDAMLHIGLWLVAKGHTNHCQELRTVLRGASEDARHGSLRYFVDSKCPAEGMSVAVELLLSKDKDLRIAACNTLAEIGDATVLRKLEALASSDSYSEINEEMVQSGGADRYAVKSYPVRDVCLEAAGKIKIRTQ